MNQKPKGLASITPEQRIEMQRKAQLTRKAGAEQRENLIASGIDLKTPIKAIRAKCLDCAGYQYSEVEKCTVPTCPLFPYRFGKRPREMSDFEVVKKIEIEEDDSPTLDESEDEIEVEE